MPPVIVISVKQSYQMQTLDIMGQGANINSMSIAQFYVIKMADNKSKKIKVGS
jgi:hypothetical protein